MLSIDTNPIHRALRDAIVSVLGCDEVRASSLDAYLVDDLGADPFCDGPDVAAEIERIYPRADPEALAYIEDNLGLIRMRDLCAAVGVSAHA